jgi:hypothetical protein
MSASSGVRCLVAAVSRQLVKSRTCRPPAASLTHCYSPSSLPVPLCLYLLSFSVLVFLSQIASVHFASLCVIGSRAYEKMPYTTTQRHSHLALSTSSPPSRSPPLLHPTSCPRHLASRHSSRLPLLHTCWRMHLTNSPRSMRARLVSSCCSISPCCSSCSKSVADSTIGGSKLCAPTRDE